MTLPELIIRLNSVHTSGYFEINTESDIGIRVGFDECKPTDLVIEYSYDNDHLSNDESDELIDWLYGDEDGGWRVLKKWMSDNGYHEVYDNDGSGNGLYYGVVVFRK